MKRHELILWRDSPIDVDIHLYEYVASNWTNQVFMISMRNFSEERKLCGMDVSPKGIVCLYLEKAKHAEIMRFINEHDGAIYLFSGFRGEKQKYLNYIIKKKTSKVAFIAERPNYTAKKIDHIFKQCYYRVLYHYYANKYNKHIISFYAMGKKGVSQYKSFGFNEFKIYPFMYCPDNGKSGLSVSEESNNRFIYIGRFDKKIKGVDMLLSALDNLPVDNWAMDFVGGYGDYKDEVYDYVEKHDNSKFLGKWDTEEVVEKLGYYDLLIVPSKSDGWNVTVNQAISAYIGVIASDETVSDELIQSSKAGLVFSANNSKQLEESILYALNNPEEILLWKTRAKDYSKKITKEIVGDYFIHVMDFSIGYRADRPICPWL